MESVNQLNNQPIYPNNIYQNQPYPGQPVMAAKKDSDTIFTKRFKENFSFFGIGSLLYGIFYAFCLYHNTSGITYPFFVIGTLCYFFFSVQKLGVPYKRNSIFYIISLVLLGISNCLTTSPQLLFMNKCGIFLLSFILMLHTMYNDKEWNLPKYFVAFFETIGTCFACIFRPFNDMISYFDAQKQDKTGKKSYFLPVLIGIAITFPLLAIITALLSSADIVFAKMIDRVFASFNFTTILELFFLILFVFFCSYAVYAALCMKNVQEEVKEQRKWEPVIAIIFTAALSIVYLLFSIIQIMYLFIGNMQLPEGYTYSGYAREGFFQLLAVCIINLVLVLIGHAYFKQNAILKGILTIMSLCTYIMIASSAYRMILYIKNYYLTFLRIFVLWSLAVIFILLTGVIISIFKEMFPLFKYSMVVVTICYLLLSFSHPDYWIAKCNIANMGSSSSDFFDAEAYKDYSYLTRLSADAAPAFAKLFAEEGFTMETTYLSESSKDYVSYSEVFGGYRYDEESWGYYYLKDVYETYEKMNFRSFNLSKYIAYQVLK